jgi:uncharacterized integral membrane protein (TIGR00698 family)
MAAVAFRGLRLEVLPGVAAAIAIAFAARYVSEWVGTSLFQLSKSPISPIMLAVLTGVAIRSSVGALPQLDRGIALAASAVLRVGLALVGLRLTLAGLGALGLRALPVVVGCLGVAWLVIPRIARAFGLSDVLVTLLTVGTSICGCTAVMATAPIIRARAEETGYAVTIVVIIGLTGMLIYPAIVHGLGFDPTSAGIFLGSAIHDTSQVIGAALLYSSQYNEPTALDAATVTKLLRNLSLVAVIPALAALQARADGIARAPGIAGAARLVPGFVLAFVALAALRSTGDALATPGGAFESAWSSGLVLANQASELLLTIGMAAVGLTVELGQMRRVGWQPLAAGALAALLTAGVSFGLISALY